MVTLLDSVQHLQDSVRQTLFIRYRVSSLIIGELAVKGDVLFKEYWNKPEATQDSFDEEGYFR